MLARFAFFVLLITPPIALAADAPPGGGKYRIVTPPPKAAAAPAPEAPTPPPLAATASPAAPDGGACRMDCAQTYYFCRAGENPDGCSPNWSQCVAGCNSPNLAPPIPAAP